MKKVTFIAVYAYSLFNPESKVLFGGAEVQLYQYAVQLAQDPNYQVSFVVGDFGQPAIESYGNITVYRSIPLLHWPRIRYITGLIYQLSFFRLLGRIGADIYIQRCAGVETGMIALFCRRKKKRFIFMTASSQDVDGSYQRTHPVAGRVYEYGLRMATQVVAQSSEQQALLTERYGRTAVLMRNSYRIPHQPPNSTNQKEVLWVGSMVGLKQPELFLDLVEQFPQQMFTMVVQSRELGLGGKVGRRAQGLHNLKLIENVPFTDIDQYFSQAKVFVNTSIFEGFPNTFIQAALRGVPILSLKVNPDQFLDKYQCGACAQDELSILAQLLSRYLQDEQKRQADGQRAYQYARQYHNLDKNILQFKKLLGQ